MINNSISKAAEKVNKLALPSKVIGLNSPIELATFANTLKKFIVKQKLYTNIKGKNYVNVEGWQFAGAAMGIFPVVKEVNRVEVEGEIKYRAEVELKSVADDRVVGFGVAVCSDKEHNRKGSEEYVIASMAQTRATGKAYRNLVAWLMKVAGYEPTPAEEMVESTDPLVEVPVGEKDAEPATAAQMKLVGQLAETRGIEVTVEKMTQGEAKQFIADTINKGGKNA